MDRYANKVYKSEETVFGNEPLQTRDKIVLFYLSVISSDFFVDKYGKIMFDMQILPKNTKEKCSFACNPYIIRIHPHQQQEYIVLHELAHAVKILKTPYHSKAFCLRYIGLVRYFLSEEQAEALKTEFRKNKIKI